MPTPIAPTISAIKLTRLRNTVARSSPAVIIGCDWLKSATVDSGSAALIAARTSSTPGAPAFSLNRNLCADRLPICISPVRSSASRDSISRSPMFRLPDNRSGSEITAAATVKSCPPSRIFSPTFTPTRISKSSPATTESGVSACASGIGGCSLTSP